MRINTATLHAILTVAILHGFVTLGMLAHLRGHWGWYGSLVLTIDPAKRLADFSASPAAMELYKENFAVLAQPGIAKPQTELPADYEQRLIKNDFAWASKNRDEILTEWRKRYDGKSEKVAAK